MAVSGFWKTLVPAGSSGRHYEVLQEIAVGGMSTVYLGARRGPSGFERVVALKRALPAQDGFDPSTLLAREAHLASRVHHQNVVSIIDVELVDDTLLLVMEYFEGVALSQLVAAGPLSPRILARILHDAADGLAAIHDTRTQAGRSYGLVHRDVSPQNILVGVDGAARIADFGIATAQDSTRNTAVGTRRGKPGYMAPEYLVHGIATPSTDVFALGVIAWEALTGRRLFGTAATLEQVHALHTRQVPPPSDFSAAVDPLLDAFVLRALGRRATAPRFDTALDFQRALERAIGNDLATPREVGRTVERIAHETLWQRRSIIRERLRRSEPLSREGSGVSLGQLVELGTQPEVPLAKRVLGASQRPGTGRVA